MTALRLLLVSLALALIVAAACNGDDGDGNGSDDTEATLQLMVLQPDEIPPGLASLGGSSSDNEEAASGLGSGPTKEQLDAWGRILGYQVGYQATEPSNASFITALSTAASLYETEQGASDSFTDRVTRARAADWQTSHSELTDFQQQEIDRDFGADDAYWLRLSGFQQTAAGVTRLITDDQIVFRIGRSWGYLNVISTAAPGVDDREVLLAEVETLTLTQIENMRAGLDSLD